MIYCGQLQCIFSKCQETVSNHQNEDSKTISFFIIIRIFITNKQVRLIFKIMLSWFQDPYASYDLNDDDDDPQPRYDPTDENK